MRGKRLYREYDGEGNLIKLECGKCHEIKSIDNFHKSKKGTDGYITTCRNCVGSKNIMKKVYREYDENGKLIKLECSKCGEIKTIENFYKSKREKDGVSVKCKSCTKMFSKKYREENKELISEKKRKWRENNKDKNSEINRQYRENNKEKLKEKSKIYRENNKEKIKDSNKRYYENNKEKIFKRNMEYYHKNIEKERIWKKNYRERNKEKMREFSRLYKEKNRELIRQKGRRYQRKHYKDKANEELIRIYENFTKNIYPNNGIQYGIIYGVHCISTDRWYIGQTIYSFNSRYNENFFKYKLDELSEDSSKLQLLQEDIEKYGQENFEIFEAIDVAFSEKELDEKEAYYIDYYKAYDEGYNSTRGNIFKHDKSKRKEVI